MILLDSYVILNISNFNSKTQLYLARVNQINVDEIIQVYLQNKQISIGYELDVTELREQQEELHNQIQKIMSQQVNEKNKIEINLHYLDQSFLAEFEPDYAYILQQLNLDNLVILSIDDNEMICQQISGSIASKQEDLIKKQIQQVNQGEKIKKYLENFNYVDYNALKLNNADLQLFREHKTITQQIQSLIQQTKIGSNNVSVYQYDFYNTDQLDFRKCSLNVDSIISFLGNYVVLQQDFIKNINAIQFYVILSKPPTDNQHQISIVEEPPKSPLETIKYWLANYPEPRTPEIQNYLKNISSENFIQVVADTANQQLFDNYSTVQAQIQFLIDEAKDKAIGRTIDIMLSHENGFQNCVCSVDAIFKLLGDNVIIDFEIAKNKKLIIYCPK
ncbi:hypothetical protein SS50377_24565 [Spironucleus salmonicida]|uniref:Uncharacterized protein n=1 Tax=Spironucleus salmonicida TaxID=348837 RepID=A0A9P8LQQ6_9EUKA|nr:hypothetical protein SS50377_24565 [Spironucleus salmonicida]